MSAKKFKILVVDDNTSNLELMLYLLRAFGYEPTAATDGSSGWEEARTGGYDLILTDILMPGIDGFELTRRLGTLDTRPPIVAVTALAMAGDRDKMLEAGFDDYLAKPIDPASLRDQIESYLALGPRRGHDSRR